MLEKGRFCKGLVEGVRSLVILSLMLGCWPLGIRICLLLIAIDAGKGGIGCMVWEWQILKRDGNIGKDV